MQKISNLLRQRLSARPTPQTHPDPDLLTAYVEEALAEAERTHVVQHLAECSDCRAVVSLSLSQLQAEPVVQPATTHSRWWLPTLRWTAAAATIAIAATLVIEKPWKVQPVPEPQSQQFSAMPPSVAPGNTDTASTNALPPAPNRVPTLEARRDQFVAGERDFRAAQPATAQRAASEESPAPPPPPPAFTGGVLAQNGSVQAVQMPERARRVAHSEEPPATGASPKDKDYVNTNLLKQEQPGVVSETVEVSAEAIQVETSSAPVTAANLPSAPAPKTSVSGATKVGNAPALTAENTRNTFDISVTPPKTAAPPTPAGKDDSTLASQSGFARHMGSKVASVVRKMANGGSESSTMAFSNADANLANSSPKEADARQRYKVAVPPQFHWRITPGGILMKSTDLSQWHEAYPQGADVQFKTFFTMGRQVWAGGNNGTLIHSWNGGVDWDTLKVPDAASSDITAISIDDGWQVKTSNGQTFVSHDHGQTWVPLKQESR